MRNIAIIGAGQAGLQLAFGLLKAGYSPTLYSDLSADEIYNGPARPVTIQFGASVEFETDLGLRFWEESRYSTIQNVYMTVFSPVGERKLVVGGELEKSAQCIDLRMKFSQWLEEYERRGGNLVVEKCDIESLERIACDNELVIVGAGRGQFMQLFEKDEEKMEFDKPQRQVAMFYTRSLNLYKQMEGHEGITDKQLSRYSIIEGVGEVIIAPFLSKSGEEHHYVQFEAIPGQGMDMFDPKGNVAEQYEMGKSWLQEHQPMIYELLADSSVTAEQEWVCGRIPPTVRKPVAFLPSGRAIFGVGDAVVVNDPILAQGLNGASKWMGILLEQILERGEQEFDERWMQSSFDTYWETAQYNNKFTNTALRGLSSVQQKIFLAASTNIGLAQKLLDSIGEAHKLNPWYWDDAEADKLIAQYS